MFLNGILSWGRLLIFFTVVLLFLYFSRYYFGVLKKKKKTYLGTIKGSLIFQFDDALFGTFEIFVQL